jgi:hypothetical protein
MATPNNQFRLRLNSNTAYNFTIYWGDGTYDVFNGITPVYQGATGNSSTWTTQISAISAFWPGITRTYATPGNYNVRVLENVPGGFPGLQYIGFNNEDGSGDVWDPSNEFNNDAKKLTKISQWGTVKWDPLKAMNNTFEGCINLKDVVTDGGTSTLSALSSFQQAWYSCTSLSSFPLIDTSKGTNFTGTWRNCTSLSSFPLIDTSKGTNFTDTWHNCDKLTSFPAINTLSGTSFGGTWFNCASLTAFPALDMNKATNLSNTWEACRNMTTFGVTALSGFTGYLFFTWKDCNKLKEFPLININANSYDRVWENCDALSSFPLIDMSKNTGRVYACWNGCDNLRSFPLLDTKNVTDFGAAWSGCTSLTSFPALSTQNGTLFNDAWSSCTSLSSFPLIDTSKGTNFTRTWNNCTSLSSFPLIDTSKGTNFTSTWSGCTKLTEFPVISTQNGNASFYYTWSDCTSLSSFPLLGTPNAISFEGAFYIAHQYGWSSAPILWQAPLTACPDFLAIPNNVKNVTTFKNTWRGQRNITDTLNFVSAINNSKVTNVAGAWQSCHGITSFSSDVMLSGVNLFGQSSQNEPMAYDSTNNSYNDWPIRGSGAWANTKMTTFPLLCTQNGTDFSCAWYNSSNLSAFPALNIGKGTKFVRTWSRCNMLSSFPALDFRSAYQINGAWALCSSLTSVEYIELSGCRYFGGAWSGLNKIKDFPQINTLSATSFYDCWRGGGAWQNCVSLTAFPMINTSNCTNFKSAWENCYSLSASPFPQLDMSKMKADDAADSFNRLYEPDDGGQCGFGGRDCFKGVKLQTHSYSALLTSLCATNFNSNVQFHGGLSNFNQAGKDARDYLVNTKGWTIGGSGSLEL